VCKDKEKNVDFRMQFLDFLKHKFQAFNTLLSRYPLVSFLPKKAKKDTASNEIH